MIFSAGQRNKTRNLLDTYIDWKFNMKPGKYFVLIVICVRSSDSTSPNKHAVVIETVQY